MIRWTPYTLSYFLMSGIFGGLVGFLTTSWLSFWLLLIAGNAWVIFARLDAHAEHRT